MAPGTTDLSVTSKCSAEFPGIKPEYLPETHHSNLSTEVTHSHENAPLGPYSRPMPRVLWWSWGGGHFLMREVPHGPARNNQAQVPARNKRVITGNHKPSRKDQIVDFQTSDLGGVGRIRPRRFYNSPIKAAFSGFGSFENALHKRPKIVDVVLP
jgi:hypothetical protein